MRTRSELSEQPMGVMMLKMVFVVIFALGFSACEDQVGYVVQKGPAIEANTKKVDFGEVDVGTQAFMEIDLSNIGESLLQVSEVFVQPAGTVFGYMGETDFNLQLNRSRVLQLYFWPVAVAPYSATLEIYSDAENFPIYSIELVGEGKEWSLCGSCDDPPENECLPGGYLLIYEQNGTCDDSAECRYAANVVPCADTCVDGACTGDGGIIWPEETEDAGIIQPQPSVDAGSQPQDPPIVDAGNSNPNPCPGGDADNDGICDGDDNCVDDANTSQADGDNDGIGDACDTCPALPNGEGEDSDDDGIDDSCGGDHCYDGMSSWSPVEYPVPTGSLTRVDPEGNNQWVVEDSRTGRTWLSCLYNTASGEGCEAIDPYDDYNPDTENDYMNWMSQWTRCTELTWAGYSDWTIPSINELHSLTDFSPDTDAINAAVFPNLIDSGGHNALVWSRSDFSTTEFFSYSFGYSSVDWHSQGAELGVLCVREMSEAQRCFDLQDNTNPDEDVIVDHTAGLVWQADNWGYNNDWSRTANYGGYYPSPITSPCNASYGGHDDWRLPTVSEFAGLVVFGSDSPAWPELFGPVSSNKVFWTATRDADNISNYWVVDLSTGDIKIQPNDYSAKVKCVRDSVD